MNADVEKAVESLDQSLEGLHPAEAHWSAIKQALRDQKADIARLNADCRQRMLQAMENGQSAHRQRVRAERAEALLRDLTQPNAGLFPDLVARITAHLGAEQ